MRGLDVIGGSATLGIGNPYAALASGILKTAGGIADAFTGDTKQGGGGGGDEIKAMKQALEAAEAKAKAEAALREAAMYRKIAIGGGVAVAVAAVAGFIVFKKKPAMAVSK